MEGEQWLNHQPLDALNMNTINFRFRLWLNPALFESSKDMQDVQDMQDIRGR